jgi:hypothetical protein
LGVRGGRESDALAVLLFVSVCHAIAIYCHVIAILFVMFLPCLVGERERERERENERDREAGREGGRERE